MARDGATNRKKQKAETRAVAFAGFLRARGHVHQPSQRMKVPMTWRVDEWPGMGSGFFFSSKRPVRGPTMAAPQKAAQPPVMCTMPEPAKSCMPRRKEPVLKAEIQPSPDQPQWTTTG